MIVLSDAGYNSVFRPLFRQMVILGRLALGRPGDLFVDLIHAQWRVFNPALTFPYFLVFVWAVIRARERPTAARITLAGAVYLSAVAILPQFLTSGFRVEPIPFVGDWLDAALPRFITEGMGITFVFGGTSLLILVGVAMDTVQQVESQLIMRHYDGFMKKTRIRGRRG